MTIQSRLVLTTVLLASALMPQMGNAADAPPLFDATGTATHNAPDGVPLLQGRENPKATLNIAMMDDMPMGGGTAQQPPAQGNAPMQMPPASAQSGSPASGGMGGMMEDDMPMAGSSSMQQPSAQGSPAQAMPVPQAGGMNMMDMMRMDPAMQGMSMPSATGQAGPPASGGMCSMMMDMMRMAPSQQGMAATQSGSTAGTMGSPAARLEGNIAFMRTELRIGDAQAPAWDAFAAALRDSHVHLDAARAALQDKNMGGDPVAQLEAFEKHLTARTQAVRSTRQAFDTLYAQLDEAQKSMVTSTILPFISVF